MLPSQLSNKGGESHEEHAVNKRCLLLCLTVNNIRMYVCNELEKMNHYY